MFTTFGVLMKYSTKHIATRLSIFSFLCCLSAFNYSNAQKSEYKKAIDSLQKISKDIQYRNLDSALMVFSSLSNYYKLDNNIDKYNIIQLNVANCYNIQQKNNEALKIYNECSKYFMQKNDSVHLYTVYTGIAGIYYNLDDGDKDDGYKIVSYQKMAAQICNVNKYPNLKFTTLINLGNSFVRSKQYDSALQSYKQAEGILKFLKDSTFSNHLKIELAYLYYLEHKYELAINSASAGLRSNNGFDVRLTMRGFYILGVCYLDIKNFSKSELYLDSAVIMSKKIDSQRDTYEFLLDIVNLDEAVGDYKKATKDLHEILTLKDNIFELSKSKFTKELLVKYDTEKKDYENALLENENAKRSSIIKWQRVLIFVVALLSLAVISILFFYLRFRNRQQKKLMEKDKIDAELKALKAQLNPHFIQNIFQIITNQVNTNPAEVAGFLQKTSNYFRSVLNGTDKNIQSLEDEIIFTEKYLQFQQSLFGNKLTYNFNVADDVDSFGIIVPAMLLQPFIENSIKYGLQLYQKPMHIEIACTKDDKFLHISIIDNGTFLVNETVVNDKSFGNALIGKRLHLFYKDAINKPKLKANPVENNTGFKVEISLPL